MTRVLLLVVACLAVLATGASIQRRNCGWTFSLGSCDSSCGFQLRAPACSDGCDCDDNTRPEKRIVRCGQTTDCSRCERIHVDISGADGLGIKQYIGTYTLSNEDAGVWVRDKQPSAFLAFSSQHSMWTIVSPSQVNVHLAWAHADSHVSPLTIPPSAWTIDGLDSQDASAIIVTCAACTGGPQNHYYDSTMNVCKSVLPCKADEEEVAAPTPTSNRVCRRCGDCQPGEYETGECTVNTPSCLPCPTNCADCIAGSSGPVCVDCDDGKVLRAGLCVALPDTISLILSTSLSEFDRNTFMSEARKLILGTQQLATGEVTLRSVAEDNGQTIVDIDICLQQGCLTAAQSTEHVRSLLGTLETRLGYSVRVDTVKTPNTDDSPGLSQDEVQVVAICSVLGVLIIAAAVLLMRKPLTCCSRERLQEFIPRLSSVSQVLPPPPSPKGRRRHARKNKRKPSKSSRDGGDNEPNLLQTHTSSSSDDNHLQTGDAGTANSLEYDNYLMAGDVDGHKRPENLPSNCGWNAPTGILKWWRDNEFVRGVGISKRDTIHSWFMGPIDKARSNAILAKGSHGAFHIRLSTSHFGYFLSVMCRERVRHFAISLSDDRRYVVAKQPAGKRHRSLNHLVHFHAKVPIKGACRLRRCRSDGGRSYEQLVDVIRQLSESSLSGIFKADSVSSTEDLQQWKPSDHVERVPLKSEEEQGRRLCVSPYALLDGSADEQQADEPTFQASQTYSAVTMAIQSQGAETHAEAQPPSTGPFVQIANAVYNPAQQKPKLERSRSRSAVYTTHSGATEGRKRKLKRSRSSHERHVVHHAFNHGAVEFSPPASPPNVPQPHPATAEYELCQPESKHGENHYRNLKSVATAATALGKPPSPEHRQLSVRSRKDGIEVDVGGKRISFTGGQLLVRVAPDGSITFHAASTGESSQDSSGNGQQVVVNDAEVVEDALEATTHIEAASPDLASESNLADDLEEDDMFVDADTNFTASDREADDDMDYNESEDEVAPQDDGEDKLTDGSASPMLALPPPPFPEDDLTDRGPELLCPSLPAPPFPDTAYEMQPLPSLPPPPFPEISASSPKHPQLQSGSSLDEKATGVAAAFAARRSAGDSTMDLPAWTEDEIDAGSPGSTVAIEIDDHELCSDADESNRFESRSAPFRRYTSDIVVDMQLEPLSCGAERGVRKSKSLDTSPLRTRKHSWTSSHSVAMAGQLNDSGMSHSLDMNHSTSIDSFIEDTMIAVEYEGDEQISVL